MAINCMGQAAGTEETVPVKPRLGITGMIEAARARKKIQRFYKAAFRDLLLRARQLKWTDLEGLAITYKEERIGEAYFNHGNCYHRHGVRSVAKSVTALLVGCALDRSFIANEDDPISLYLPNLPPEKREIRISDLLTMRSGLDADDINPESPGHPNKMAQEADWRKFVFSVPMLAPPGQRYAYSSCGVYLLGLVLESATHRTMASLLASWLLEPLHGGKGKWIEPVRKISPAQGNLRLSLRSMAALGTLISCRGRHKNVQIVSESWVAKCVSPIVAISDISAYNDYCGYLWFSSSIRSGGTNHAVHNAYGDGGTGIFVVPEFATVLAISGSGYGQPQARERSFTLLQQYVETLSRELA